MISFYKKYDWYNINKNVTSDSKKRLNLMILNKKIKFKKIFFYT